MRGDWAVGAVAAVLVLVTAAVAWEGAFFAPTAEAVPIPPPAVDEAPADGVRTAVFAGGCFWGVQAVFQHVNGVRSAVSGYAGGRDSDPTYVEVSSGATGHAEAVRVTYDPAVISYGRLLQVFFSVAHDPTQLNRQGPDYGAQYRSAIFAASDEQLRIAQAYLAQLDAADVYDAPVVTTVAPLDAFYRAEDYHQDYAERHPDAPYIVRNDRPKVAALAEMFPDDWREEPALVRPFEPT